MIDEVINEIKKSFLQNENVADGNPYFHDKRYQAFDFSKNNYHTLKHEETKRKIVFVDGGNAEIVKLPNFSLHIVRIYFNIFKGKKKINTKIPQKIDCYVAVFVENKNGEIYYKTELFPLKKEFSTFLPFAEDLVFSSLDNTLRIGPFKADISRIGAVTRRFMEWYFCSHIIENLEEDDIIVRDGSLQTSVSNESTYANNVYNIALKNNVIFTGLSKTCNLLTDTGKSLIDVIKKHGPVGVWYYHPVVDITHPDHRAEMLFVKLNENAEHVFRLEILKNQFNNVDSILAPLVQQSNDYRFPGYPYGLIDADTFARITEEERATHIALFTSLTKDVDITSMDAHKILNKLIR